LRTWCEKNGEEFASRKDAKHALSAVEGGAKFGEIKVGAAKEKVVGGEGPLRAWRPFGVAQDMLGGKIDPKIASRKDAKGAKFGKIKVGAAKEKVVGWRGALRA
jgi:hypothetical protein